MAFEESFQNYIYLAIDLFAVLTAVFASLVVYRLWKKEYKPHVKHTMLNIFILLALGYISYVFAEISWDIQYKLNGVMPVGSWPDLFYFIGYMLIIISFTYFSFYMYKQHGNLTKGMIMMTSFFVLSAAVLYYLISKYILGFQAGESGIEIFFDYFYPIMSALILIVSTNVFIFFKKLPDIGMPLLLLMITSIMNFIGDMLYTYYSWNEVYGLAGMTSDIFYLAGYAISAAAFYMLFKRIKTGISQQETKG